jgi:hypothetical protein
MEDAGGLESTTVFLQMPFAQTLGAKSRAPSIT